MSTIANNKAFKQSRGWYSIDLFIFIWMTQSPGVAGLIL